MDCDPNVAGVEFARLLEVGERSVPAVLALIDSGRQRNRVRIIRQRATSNNQLITGTVEITTVKVNEVVIASQLQVSLPQIWTQPQRGLGGFLCQIEVHAILAPGGG